MTSQRNLSLKGDYSTNSQFVNIVASISQAMQKMKVVFTQQMQVIESTLELLVTSGDDVRMKSRSSTDTLFDSNDKKLHPCCDQVLNKLSVMEEIVQKLCDSMCSNTVTSNKHSPSSLKQQTPVLLVAENKPATVEAQVSLDSSFQVITLNSEEDYPSGSWLGNENIIEARVRVPIAPMTLLHINSYCLTPEKMAVTLLDYLFPREVLAVSNLSGKGKHGKKQLDPLMIYAIRCHLMHKFHITEKDWYRIKQNMDSKCRTTWRKKMRGQPLGGKKLPLQNDTVCLLNSNSNSSNGTSPLKSDAILLSSMDPLSLSGPFNRGDFEDAESGLGQNVESSYKVVRVTQEQLEKYQNASTILEVFTEDDEGPLLSEEDTSMTLDDDSERTLVSNSDQDVSVLTIDSNLQESQFIDCD